MVELALRQAVFARLHEHAVAAQVLQQIEAALMMDTRVFGRDAGIADDPAAGGLQADDGAGRSKNALRAPAERSRVRSDDLEQQRHRGFPWSQDSLLKPHSRCPGRIYISRASGNRL